MLNIRVGLCTSTNSYIDLSGLLIVRYPQDMRKHFSTMDIFSYFADIMLLLCKSKIKISRLLSFLFLDGKVNNLHRRLILLNYDRSIVDID